MQTARPMTAEEFAEQSRLHTEAEEDLELDKVIEDAADLAYADEGTADSGDLEVGADSGKDLSGIEADLSELMAGKEVYAPTMRFGKSLVSENTIKFYISKGYFPEGIARAPDSKIVLAPKVDEAIVFKDFFTTRLRFPCDKDLHKILDRYRANLHHLTLNTFSALSKFC